MTVTGRLAAPALLTASMVLTGCGTAAVRPPQVVALPQPQHRLHDLILLLPDDDSGTTGRAVVSNARGTIELDAAGAWTRVAVADAPADPQIMSDHEVRATFGRLLASLPPPALAFTLHFRFDSDELTAASLAHLAEILRATRDRPVPDVVVVGHTDRSGPSELNVQLGLKRAQAVRKLLLETGMDADAIRVSSHGEAEPLIATDDNVFEPRNRRVEVTVR